MQTGSFLWKDGKCWSAWRTLCATSVLPWWPTWCLHKHRSRLPCRWSSDGNLLLGKREIHRLHQSQRVSAGLESSIIFNNYNWQSKKKAVIEFIAAYGNCYWSLEAQQWGYWHQNGTIQLLRECLKCRDAEGRREGVKIFEESEPFFQVRGWGPCLLPRHPEIHSTAAWSEIWIIVQRWSRGIWLAVICVDGWKCPQLRGKTAWMQTFLQSFTPIKIVWKNADFQKKKKKGAVLWISE